MRAASLHGRPLFQDCAALFACLRPVTLRLFYGICRGVSAHATYVRLHTNFLNKCPVGPACAPAVHIKLVTCYSLPASFAMRQMARACCEQAQACMIPTPVDPRVLVHLPMFGLHVLQQPQLLCLLQQAPFASSSHVWLLCVCHLPW
ncbi:hypothetical protein COO60DRAFT_1699494 [Scenedesmus sp. NREL 46B-D3]|nr:hypothetical protein COO60DRAFT_1699494 [Scenedesmus sp. NREL 46B-D3]